MADREKKKRQHFVPRLLLRNFSEDRKTITLALVADGRVITGASLREQCAKSYLYSDDLRIENGFAEMEGHIANLFARLDSDPDTQLSRNEVDDIRFFVHYQRQRTVVAAERLNSIYEELMKQLASYQPQFAGVDMGQFEIRMPDAQLEALMQANKTLPLLLDMQLKLLVNSHPVLFCISDHPVAFYNQWAEHHPRFRRDAHNAGLAVKGLQIFLPLSPRSCLALFDPSTYQYGSDVRQSCSLSKHDVVALNEMQALNAHRCLYSRAPLANGQVAAWLAARTSHKAVHNAQRQVLHGERDGKPSDLVVMGHPSLRTGARLSFARVIDKGSYNTYPYAVVPSRTPELIALADMMAEHIDDFIDRQRARADEGLELQCYDPDSDAER